MFKKLKYLCLLLIFAMPALATNYGNFQFQQISPNTLNSKNIQSNGIISKEADDKFNISINENNIIYTKTKNKYKSRTLSDVVSSRETPTIVNTFGKDKDYLELKYQFQLKDSITEIMLASFSVACGDPYAIKINNTKYYMVINSKNGKYTLNNIVGYGDAKNSLFKSLNKYNTDKNSQLTKKELIKANIRFVAVINGKLQVNDKSKDFDINKISYIDMKNTRESINNGTIGSFGYFDVYIKDEYDTVKKIIGFVTFDSEQELKEMIQ